MIGRRKLATLEVSAIGLGCMSMTPIYGVPDPEEATATLHRAPELGIDFIYTSDAYGANRANEELVGRGLKGRREKYILATKFGNIRLPDGRPGAKGNPEYVMEACDKSLKRLGTDYIRARLPPAATTVSPSKTLVCCPSIRRRGRSPPMTQPRPMTAWCSAAGTE